MQYAFWDGVIIGMQEQPAAGVDASLHPCSVSFAAATANFNDVVTSLSDLQTANMGNVMNYVEFYFGYVVMCADVYE